jgi:hypothetical protein
MRKEAVKLLSMNQSENDSVIPIQEGVGRTALLLNQRRDIATAAECSFTTAGKHHSEEAATALRDFGMAIVSRRVRVLQATDPEGNCHREVLYLLKNRKLTCKI